MKLTIEIGETKVVIEEEMEEEMEGLGIQDLGSAIQRALLALGYHHETVRGLLGGLEE
jgi:hypothetical protein